MQRRPMSGECEPYYETYISKVPEGDVVEAMATQIEDTVKLLRGIDEEKAGYRYAPDKWTLKGVIGHVIDTERMFCYRALAFARQDPASLPGIEQDDYAANSNVDRRPFNDVVEEFYLLRQSTVSLFKGFDDEIWDRRGKASGFEFTVRSLAFIIAGHELHHVGVIKERYL